jgi:hypothetical protein
MCFEVLAVFAVLLFDASLKRTYHLNFVPFGTVPSEFTISYVRPYLSSGISSM